MIGEPKYLNTKDDFEGIHALAVSGKMPAEPMRQQWQGLLEGAYTYEFDKDLASGASPDGTAPDYIVLNVEQLDGTVVRRQEKRVRSTSSRLDRLGYTEAEVQAKIAELGG